MKKLLALCLTAVLCLTFFASCTPLKHEHISEWKYNEHTHWQSVICTTSQCDFNMPAPENHVDDDKNGVCDVCGYDLSKHEHTGKWYMNEEIHFYEYTCGCPSPDIAEFHLDGDGDEKCDICGYVMQEPPTNYFLRNQAGCEWLNEITAEDIEEIKIINEYVGVAPGNLKNIERSTDEAVIARIFEDYYWLDTAPISKMEGQICGGAAVTAKFILKNGLVKTLYINNGNYCDANGNYFELLKTPQFKVDDNALKAYGFITYIGTGTVYDKDNNPVCEIPMGELEFVGVDAEIDLADNPVKYIVEAEFGNLYFLSGEYFYIESNDAVYYRLIGKNLDELIAYATAPEYTLTMNDEDWLYEPLKSAYKAGDVVAVKIGKAFDLGYLFFVNGERIYQSGEGREFWEFTFTMPNCNVVIDFKTYDGFLPNINYAILCEVFWTKYLDSDFVYVSHYYGEFESGAIVAMIESGYYDEALWDETVADTVIHYNNGNRIIVLFGGEFYTLSKAYENGYITNDDLTVISQLHQEFFPYLYEENANN